MTTIEVFLPSDLVASFKKFADKTKRMLKVSPTP